MPLLDFFEMVLGTGSPFTRRGEANPEAGTEQDIVRVLRRGVERLLAEAGVAEEDMNVKTKMLGVLLMFKRT